MSWRLCENDYSQIFILSQKVSIYHIKANRTNITYQFKRTFLENVSQEIISLQNIFILNRRHLSIWRDQWSKNIKFKDQIADLQRNVQKLKADYEKLDNTVTELKRTVTQLMEMVKETEKSPEMNDNGKLWKISFRFVRSFWVICKYTGRQSMVIDRKNISSNQRSRVFFIRIFNVFRQWVIFRVSWIVVRLIFSEKLSS